MYRYCRFLAAGFGVGAVGLAWLRASSLVPILAMSPLRPDFASEVVRLLDRVSRLSPPWLGQGTNVRVR